MRKMTSETVPPSLTPALSDKVRRDHLRAASYLLHVPDGRDYLSITDKDSYRYNSRIGGGGGGGGVRRKWWQLITTNI